MKTKNEVKHTPGKWRAQESWLDDRDHISWRANVIGGGKIVAIASGIGQEETDANARLIASCPIMYDYVYSKAKEGDKNAKEIINSIDG